jgi:hypothetical protein
MVHHARWPAGRDTASGGINFIGTVEILHDVRKSDGMSRNIPLTPGFHTNSFYRYSR